MRPSALLALLLALGSALARADTQTAEQSPRDPIRVTSLNDGRFRFAQGNLRTVLDLNASISGCTGSLYDGAAGKKFGGSVRARVLDEVRKAPFWYVVMQVDTNTGCNVQGMCGAGSSTDVIWLKLDARLRAAARQALNVEDCATNRELSRFSGQVREGDSAKLEMRGGVLALESKHDDYDRKTSAITGLRYNHRRPERGLVLTKRQQPLR